MAHAHIDNYAAPATARASGSEVHIDLGDIHDGGAVIRLAMNKDEATILAAEILAATQTLPE